MEIALNLLADFANVTPDGKINMLGVFKRIPAYQVPHQVPCMSLVLLITASPGEKGTTHKLNVVIVDEDGSPLIPPADINLQVPANAPGTEVEVNAIVNMNGVVFKKFGSHMIDVLIDGQSKARISFSLIAVPPPPGMNPFGKPPS